MIPNKKPRIREMTEYGRPPLGNSLETQGTGDHIELKRVKHPLVGSVSKLYVLHN